MQNSAALNANNPKRSSGTRPLRPVMQQENVDYIHEITALLAQSSEPPRCKLKYDTPFQLLIATILATQCSEEKVNAITPRLFTTYPTPQTFIDAPRGKIEHAIRATGFSRQKAKFIQETSRILIDKYSYNIPRTIVQLTQLPGIARKAANLILGELYGLSDGMLVDTHIHRIANRLNLSQGKSATKVEQDLLKVVPPELRIELSARLMSHGQTHCRIHKPLCHKCTLSKICPSSQNKL